MKDRSGHYDCCANPVCQSIWCRQLYNLPTRITGEMRVHCIHDESPDTGQLGSTPERLCVLSLLACARLETRRHGQAGWRKPGDVVNVWVHHREGIVGIR